MKGKRAKKAPKGTMRNEVETMMEGLRREEGVGGQGKVKAAIVYVHVMIINHHHVPVLEPD